MPVGVLRFIAQSPSLKLGRFYGGPWMIRDMGETFTGF
jgi:hypothetical protein